MSCSVILVTVVDGVKTLEKRIWIPAVPHITDIIELSPRARFRVVARNFDIGNKRLEIEVENLDVTSVDF